MAPMEYIDPTPENIRDLGTIPELVPPTDVIFTYLLEEAVRSRLHVYFAAVPLTLVRPFAPDFDMEAHPIGKQMVDALYEDGCRGKFSNLWVYPRDDHFVVSDDYAMLAAARRGDPESVPCWVMGDPRLPGVGQIQGPIHPNEVRRMVGLPPMADVPSPYVTGRSAP